MKVLTRLPHFVTEVSTNTCYLCIVIGGLTL